VRRQCHESCPAPGLEQEGASTENDQIQPPQMKSARFQIEITTTRIHLDKKERSFYVHKDLDNAILLWSNF
jgi:hypothetical protein